MGEGQREGEEPFVAFQVVSHEKPEYTPRLPMASQLLPLSIPELAFSCICTAQACTNTETGTIVNTYFSRRTSVLLGGVGGHGDFVSPFFKRLLLLQGVLECSCVCILYPKVHHGECSQVSVRCQVATCLCVFRLPLLE